MRSHVLVCLALVLVLAACGLKAPAELAPTQEPSPAPPPTAAIAPESSPTPLAMRTPVVVPDPKADPLAALRYSILPQILQTAVFTLTVAQTLGPVDASPASVTVKPLPTAETAADVKISTADLFNFTTLSWGTVRLVDSTALEATQQWQAGTKLVLPLDVVVAGDFRWLRFPSSPWSKEGPLGGVDADTQPLFGTLMLPEIRALLAALGEATTAEWVEDTSIDGESVHHLRFSPRLDGLHPCLLSAGLLYTPEPLPCGKGTPGVEGEAWLSAENLTPRQLRLRVTQEGIGTETRLVINHTLQLRDINRPVEIEPPPPSTPVPTPPPPPAAPPPAATSVAETDGMFMVYVPAGEFLMGSAGGDADAKDAEKPQHAVYLDAYWIDRTEVTAAQFQQCVAAGKCVTPSCAGTRQGEHPVVCVTWQDAANYCTWAGRRLPSEAEWEKAARGTDGRKYPWGDEAPYCKWTNFYGDSKSCLRTAAAVGTFPSDLSPYGVMDMAGNVEEWVSDWWDAQYYASSPGQNPKGPASGQSRVKRGGSFQRPAASLRAAARYEFGPATRYHFLGFRCARNP